MVEQLWRSSNFKDLSSYFISYEYLRDWYIEEDLLIEKGLDKSEIHNGINGERLVQVGLYDDDDRVENGVDLLKTIYKKQNKRGVSVDVYEVQKYVELGDHPSCDYGVSSHDDGSGNQIDLNGKG